MAKKKKQAPRAKPVRIISPKKELNSVRKEIRQIKNPVYAINRKIKNAPSKYYERKYKKEKKAYLESIDDRLSNLTNKRSDLSIRLKNFESNKAERDKTKRKVYSLEKRIQKAVDDKDIKVAEALRYDLLKQLGILDKLHKDLGVPIPGTVVSDKKTEDQDGGQGYESDPSNPYAIWEAIKQLHIDLDQGEWKYFIVNGKRFSTENADQILAEASIFWITAKQQTGGTPYVMRYYNDKRLTVKYISYND